jgi:hypothetical protein
MKNGSLPKNERQAADELIAGSDKDPTKLGELTDEDPELPAEADQGAEQPALAEA